MTSSSSTLWKRWRKSFACLVGFLLVMLGFGALPFWNGNLLIERTDRSLGDWIIRNSGGPAEKEELVLLGIDDASLTMDALDPAEIAASPALSLMGQRFPWDRRV